MQIRNIVQTISVGYKDFKVDTLYGGKYDINSKCNILISTIF